jgi:hypothetical protein
VNSTAFVPPLTNSGHEVIYSFAIWPKLTSEVSEVACWSNALLEGKFLNRDSFTEEVGMPVRIGAG